MLVILRVLILNAAFSFRHASRATFLPEEGSVIARVYAKGVRKNSRTPFVVERGRICLQIYPCRFVGSNLLLRREQAPALQDCGEQNLLYGRRPCVVFCLFMILNRRLSEKVLKKQNFYDMIEKSNSLAY